MRSLFFLAAFFPWNATAGSPSNWGLGMEAGAFFLNGPGATWSPGPTLGVNVNKGLPSGAYLRFLTRFVPMHLKSTDKLWSAGDLPETTLDAIAIHGQGLMALRYSPKFQGPNPKIQFGAFMEGAIGVDIVRTHADLFGPDGLLRISTTEALPIVQIGLGIHVLILDSLGINATINQQILLAFDRGERGGGDDLRVLFGTLPGLELIGHF
jgi:hypothetical protein